MGSTSSATTHASERISGLDGLRGLAVAMVLGFHLYPRLVPGGWLGVSLFFTLSGFLITTVILRDRDAGTFTFASFYARRVRRLLPAAVLVLTVFAVTWSLLGWFNDDHRTDVTFALLQVANWQQIWEGVPYGTALASPVVHYWSLAIEEQAYVVLPLLLVVFGTRWMRVVAPLLFGASVAATFVADGEQSVIYFGTHTRAAEILAGVMVAVVFHSITRRPGRTMSTVLSGAGITYLIAAALLVHLKDDVVYSGGLIVTGVVSAVVIAALPTSHLARAFNLSLFTWLGTVSYGVYLVHWPVLMTLKETSLPQWSRSPITLAATIVIAQLMHRRFELPMRFTVTPRRIMGSAAAALLVVGAAFTFANAAPKSFEDLQDNLDRDDSPAPTGDLPVFYFGDSKMMAYVTGMKTRIATTPASVLKNDMFSFGDSFARFGCPIGRGGSFMNGDTETDVGDGCDWSTQDASTTRSKIAVIWAGTWDTMGRKVPALFGDEMQSLENPAYRSWVTDEYRALFAHLRARHGVEFIAVVDHLGQGLADYQRTYDDFLGDLASDDVAILDLTSFLSQVDAGSYMPDGSHVSIGEPTEYSATDDNSAADLYVRWFEPSLCAALKEKVPAMLGDVTCPAIDYSPRAVVQ